MGMRMLSLVLVAVLVTSSLGCGASTLEAEQRQECRRARGRAVGKAVGYTLGVVVLAAVFIAAAASGSNIGSVGGGSSRRARRRGLSVCRDRPPPLRSASTLPSPAPAAPAPAPVAVDPGPPSREQLEQALHDMTDRLRSCAPGASGMLFIDADVDGPQGRVVSFVLSGEPAPHTGERCVSDTLRSLQFQAFQGVVRVRWAVALGS